MRSVIWIALTLVVGSLVVSTGFSQEVPGCGSLRNAFGPYDYRDPVARGQPLHLVESAHFTPDVEGLFKGATSHQVVGDIDYTLRAFPNHHRALNSVARYALRGGRFDAAHVPNASAECYFQRAIAFRPDDAVVRVLYANYLAKRKEPEAARGQYEEALSLAPESAEINYNAGLFFLDLGDLDRARQLAQIAYKQGYPLPGLQEKLEATESAKSKP